MMPQLLAWLALLAALNRPSDMVGKATHYHDYYHGRLTRSEEVFDQNGLTAAVDDRLWPEMRGWRLLICAERKCVMVRVNDTGWLADSGVTLDLSKRAFGELAPLRHGMVRVKAWIIEREE